MTSPHLDESEQLERKLAAAHRRNQLIIATTIAAITVAAAALLFELKLKHTWHNLKYTIVTAGDPPPAPADALSKHHGKLLADWFIMQSRARDEDSQHRADQAHQRIIENLGEDAVGVQLNQELRRLVIDQDALSQNSKSIMETVGQWNRHMDKSGQPWWVDANILQGADGPFFYTKSYKVISDVNVTVGDKPERTRIVARADHTNIRESLLGHTSPHHEGAIILADRVYDFTLQQLWPLLAETPAETLPPTARAFAPKIREEAARALEPAHFELLSKLAPHRAQLTTTIEAIRDRRSCGSRFILREPSWDGIPHQENEILRSYARRDSHAQCPSITLEEVQQLIDASEALRAEPTLKQALESLAAFVSRGVSLHEARHAADHAQLGDFNEPLPCERCDGVLSASARAELSAYLASFSDPDQAYTAMFQACSIDLNRPTPHAYAMRTFLRASAKDGCQAPMKDLAKLSRELEMQFFGRSQAITLPKDYPKRLELYTPPQEEE